jgi:DsbC/DsbD-like thiol-disulfide interchange protein
MFYNPCKNIYHKIIVHLRSLRSLLGMTTYFSRVSLAVAPFIFLFPIALKAQINTPVAWSYRYEHRSKNEIDFYITANLGPGWHLYSQEIGEGGPSPTRVIFEPGNEFVLIRGVKEVGDKKEFYDDTYEMKVAWYTGAVSFVQRIRLLQPHVSIRGYMEFMTCNNSVCVPNRKEFILQIP